MFHGSRNARGGYCGRGKCHGYSHPRDVLLQAVVCHLNSLDWMKEGFNTNWLTQLIDLERSLLFIECIDCSFIRRTEVLDP